MTLWHSLRYGWAVKQSLPHVANGRFLACILLCWGTAFGRLEPMATAATANESSPPPAAVRGCLVADRPGRPSTAAPIGLPSRYKGTTGRAVCSNDCQVPTSPNGFAASHCTMSGMRNSKPPGTLMLMNPQSSFSRFSKVWGVPPGMSA
jgi:hypothetical protein